MKLAKHVITAILGTIWAIFITWFYFLGCPYKWAIIAPIGSIILALMYWWDLITYIRNNKKEKK